MHNMMCLICSQVVKIAKEDNAKQHFCRHTSDACAKLKDESRKICVEKSVRQHTFCLSTFTKSTNNSWKVSNRVAYNFVVPGKTYSDGQLVKRCLIDVVKCVHPGKKIEYLSIAL